MYIKGFFRLACILFLFVFSPVFSQDEESNKQQEEKQTGSPQTKSPQTESPQTESLVEEIEDFFKPGNAPMSYKGAFMKMMLTLLGLVLLIVLSVWMLRRVSQGKMKQMNYGRSIKVIERRPISAKSILYLVEIGGKQVVIAESQLEVRTISTIDQLSTSED